MAAVMEKHMSGQPFLVGDTAGVADFVAAYTLDWASGLHLLDGHAAPARVHRPHCARSAAPLRIAAAFAHSTSERDPQRRSAPRRERLRVRRNATGHRSQHGKVRRRSSYEDHAGALRSSRWCKTVGRGSSHRRPPVGVPSYAERVSRAPYRVPALQPPDPYLVAWGRLKRRQAILRVAAYMLFGILVPVSCLALGSGVSGMAAGVLLSTLVLPAMALLPSSFACPSCMAPSSRTGRWNSVLPQGATSAASRSARDSGAGKMARKHPRRRELSVDASRTTATLNGSAPTPPV